MDSLTTDARQRSLPAGDLQPIPSQFIGILDPAMWPKKKKPFFVPLNALAIGAGGGTVDASYRSDPNHDTVAYVAAVKVRDTTAAHVVQNDMPLLVQIQMEDGTVFQPAGAGTFNEVDNLFGSGKQPAVWSIPLVVPAGQQVTFTFQNNHNATVLDVRATLQGFLVVTG